MKALEDIVGELRAQELSIAFAESCTGGRLSADLTRVPGSSDVVAGSAVCYQLRAKRQVLGLKGVTEDTVVSKKTARDMALACIDLYDADIGVSTTGFLDGENPRAFFAVSWDLMYEVYAVSLSKKSSRDENREIVLGKVFETLAELLEDGLSPARRALRQAARKEDPFEAVEEIEFVLNGTQEVTDLAGAKLSLLARQLPPIPRPEMGELLQEYQKRLRVPEEHLELLRTTLNLVEAASSGGTPDMLYTQGNIHLRWKNPEGLKWVVRQSAAPWPLVHVEASWAPSARGHLRKHSFRTVHSLLEHHQGFFGVPS